MRDFVLGHSNMFPTVDDCYHTKAEQSPGVGNNDRPENRITQNS